MKKVFLVVSCIAFYGLLSRDGLCNEFVQPKKKSKKMSIDTLKRRNIEVSSTIFEVSATAVEQLGMFQKKLKNSIDVILNEDTRTHQEQANKQLEDIAQLLAQAESLLLECNASLGKLIS